MFLFPLFPLQSYKMNSSPRGFALVISNVTFDTRAAPELDPRKGGEVDDEVLRKIFTELDYMVSVHRDLTAQVTQPTADKNMYFKCYLKKESIHLI